MDTNILFMAVTYWADWIPTSESGFTADFYNAVTVLRWTEIRRLPFLLGIILRLLLKPNYLLTRIFSYLGYTLNENFYPDRAF